MMKKFVPELLSPAGSLEKLKVSVLYGADAVYLAGLKFGLRQASDNFTTEELIEGVAFAHKRSVKVYVVINSFLHDSDFEELPDFLKLLSSLKIDAIIVSDLGVVKTILELTNIPVHLSTQASCLNTFSAKFWKEMGVSRIVLGREVGIREAKEIKDNTGLEVEMFIHGSMCMAYSGNCVISNYTQGRDSNRGGCAHSCRFEYSFNFNKTNENDKQYAYFMSSKDLEGVRYIPEFSFSNIDSVKVEGRNKSHHYAGTITKVYREALDLYRDGRVITNDLVLKWESELKKVSHRDYTSGSLIEKPSQESIYNQRENDENQNPICGVIIDIVPNEFIVVDVKSAFIPGDKLEILTFKGSNISFMATDINSITDVTIEKTRPGSLVKLPFVTGAEKFNLIRKL